MYCLNNAIIPSIKFISFYCTKETNYIGIYRFILSLKFGNVYLTQYFIQFMEMSNLLLHIYYTVYTV